ncbi:hypothetical protein HYDPIDRAFT_115034 [Hydnomerulius pinastri MD-312]|uniref:Uncharacterized protein n=1 Tax=Hydnomerulius pinastri MD-312 TaxID=994086 RepID=A0A0C9W5Z8_9AGAM|nr:hypothetical protein HYDPIDRAFT_115034 [Hydnomerulius pinastri MD-312]
MEDTTGNIYFTDVSSVAPQRSENSSNTDEQNMLPHFLPSLPCVADQFQPYIGSRDAARNFSAHFMHSCTTQEFTQPDIVMLQRRHSLDTGVGPAATGAEPVRYPQSSQRTTSHVPFSYTSDSSRFDFAPYDGPSNPHVIHATAVTDANQTLRNSSLPTAWVGSRLPLCRNF